MMSKTPQEIEVWYIIPALRRELVKGLIQSGLTQKQAAMKLGLTESAVSQYLSDKRAKGIKFNEKISAKIKEAVKNILEGSQPVGEIYRLTQQVKFDTTICKVHTLYDNDVPEGCNVCELYESTENLVKIKQKEAVAV
ncbi:MAG: helix-turn-helix domain-containing protein [Candidatus Aenigmarchaeota archaeon]|nr:helix-turn-helix domain-containing protein [Candidatus Aenigmarchaeota archaeon]